MSYQLPVTAYLYDTDGVLIGQLTNSFDRSFTDELSGPGVGSCSMLLADAQAAELISGRHIGVFLGGIRRFTFRIEGNPEYRQIGEGEEAQQVVTVSGRGRGAAAFDDLLVYPEHDLDLPLDTSWRLFSFASPSFPNGGAWPLSREQYEYQDGVAEGWRYQTLTDAEDVSTDYPAPVGFPWPNSPKNGNGIMPTPTYIPTYWIWPSEADDGDEGFAFFRDTFTLLAAQPVTFSVTADNLFTLYLEGVPILGEDADHWMWQGYKEVTMWVPAGTYQVAAVVENVETDLAFNPGGFLYAAYVAADNDDGALVPYVPADWTNELFTSHFSATEYPGWTPGQIIDQFITEAVARGGLGAITIDPTYLAFEDTDGNDWDSLDTETSSQFVPSFEIEVGKTGLDLLDKLHTEGWIDWHFKPGEQFDLDVWAAGQAGATTTIEFEHGVNIVTLERGETAPYANRLLVQWAKGYVVVEDAAAISSLGRVVEDVLATDAETKPDARRKARIELQRRAQDAQAAIVMTIEPDDATHCPYVGFQLGDRILIPQADGTGTESKQTLSVTMGEDSEGFARFTLELGRRWRSPERETVNLIRMIGGKTLGSVQGRSVVR